MILEEKKQLYYSIMESVSKAVKKMLLEKEETKFPLFKLSLDNVSIQELKESVYDYEEYYRKHMNEDIKSDLVMLGAKLKREFGIKDWQIGVGDGFKINNPQVDVEYKHPQRYELIVPDIKENITIIKKLMKEHGYFATVQKIIDDDRTEVTFVQLIFVKEHPDNIREYLEKLNINPYHIATNLSIDEIKQNGLTPIARKGVNHIYYPPRIYFFLVDVEKTKDTTIKDYHKKVLKSEHNAEDFYRVYIDIDKVPKDVPFYFDPLVGKESIYTTEPISKEAIVGFQKMNN